MKGITLYEHQKKAFESYKDSEYSALLFDCGVGKTITALAIAEAKGKPVLVIAPTSSLCMQWEDEVNNLMEDSICYRIDSKKKNTKKAKEAFKEFLEC